MSANIGQMFYYGEIPWHGEGYRAGHPLNVEDAIKHGGLDWEVEMVDLITADDVPSPVFSRRAVVRTDRSGGDPDRVVGVAHNDFVPLQNREGARIFDSLFGKGGQVYHTGGYLGNGQKIWLLAALPNELKILDGDTIKPFVLFANSHDGSIAIDIRLTTVRVVCQNTLSLALSDKSTKTVFKRSHHGSYEGMKLEVEAYFAGILRAVKDLESSFKSLYDTKLPWGAMDEFLVQLYPEPRKPLDASVSSVQFKSYLTRLNNVREARNTIRGLRKRGKGADLKLVRESVWGGLNAVLEYVDHYQDSKSSLIHGLFGRKADIKKKAYDLAMAYVNGEIR